MKNIFKKITNVAYVHKILGININYIFTKLICMVANIVVCVKKLFNRILVSKAIFLSVNS